MEETKNNSSEIIDKATSVTAHFKKTGTWTFAGGCTLTGTLVLLGIWLWGRVMESINGNTVFDPVMTRWLGYSIFCLLLIWLLFYAFASIKNLIQADKRWPAIAAWSFFLILAILIIYDIEGFRLFSSSILAILSGSSGTAEQGSFLLFKFHPANPMIAFYLPASLKSGLSIESVMPYVWNQNIILAIFIWSMVYGIILMIHRNLIFSKTLHLIFSACGLGVLILLKSTSAVTNQWMLFLHTSAVMLLFFQALLTYSIIRDFVLPKDDAHKQIDAFEPYYPPEKSEKKKVLSGLPPSAVTFAVCVFFLLPVLADLQHQFNMSQAPSNIQNDNSVSHKQKKYLKPAIVKAPKTDRKTG